MAVTFTPASLDFGTRPQNQPRVLEITVKTSEAVHFTVTDGEGNPAQNKLTVSPTSISKPKGAQEYTLSVTFTPTATGTYTGTLTASTGGTAAVQGVCANLTIEQSPVDFGTQPVGSKTIRSVLVSNYGSQAATLSTAGAAFTIVDAAGNPIASPTVPAGQAQLVLVKFNPGAAGSHTGTLTATRGTGGTGDTASASLAGKASDQILLGDEVGGDIGLVPTRLHIEVPTTETSLTMGRGINNLSYDGCGLSTKGDIFLNAIGDSSHFWAQSRADMVLQSFENSVYMLAKGSWTTAAVGGASLLGGGGVTIASGFREDPVVATADAKTPPDTGAAATLAGSVAKAAVAAGVIDAALAFGLGIRGLYGVGSAMYKAQQAGRLKETLANKWGVTMMGVLGGIGGIVAGVVGSWGTHATGTGGSSPFAGVSIFGAGGVVVGTPAFCSIYGLAGVVVGSMYPVIYGGDAEMMGMRSATISGYRNAVLQSHSKTTVHSDGDVEISADGGGGGGIPFMSHFPRLSRFNRGFKVGTTKAGVVSVRGERVCLGKSNLEFDDAAAGDEVVAAANHVTLRTGLNTFLHLMRDQQAYLASASKIELRVGSFVVMIKPDKILVGKSAAAQSDSEPNDPMISIEPDGIVLQKAQNQITVADDRVIVGNMQGAWLSCKDNNQLVLKGNRIELG